MSGPVIQVDNLSVHLGDHEALNNLTFELPKGAFFSIIGPNGAGKTTLLKVLFGVVAPSHGHARVFGETPGNVSPGRIGYVPQIKSLDRSFPALSYELVLTGLSNRWPWRVSAKMKRDARDALDRIGASHLAERPVGRLSGGELQRVYLARAFISRPDIIVLDEPTTGIDAVGEADLYYLMETYQKESNATIVMITHDLSAVCHLGSHVLVLNQEQIGFGAPSDALTEENLRRAFGHVGHEHAMILKLECHD